MTATCRAAKAKAVARATAKYLAAKAAEKKAVEETKDQGIGLMVRLMAQTFNIVTEQADVRQWRLLPSEIRAARADLPPGSYQASVEFFGRTGYVLSTRELPGFELPPGALKLLLVQTRQ